MEIRTIWFVAAIVVLVLIFVLPSCSLEGEPVEAAIVRGHFSDGNGVWRPDDFGWFYYDQDKGQGGEQLKIEMQGRTAEKGHIAYTSQAWSEEYEYEPWGTYQAVAFFGKPYLAGYPESDLAKEETTLRSGELREVIIDAKNTYTLTSNTSLPLINGYALAVQEISKENNVVNFVLLKNEKPVHAALVSIGGTFVYKIGDVPIILVHLAEAMSGGNSGFAEVDGIFQVSDEPVISLLEGGRLDNFELTSLSEDIVEFKNEKSLTLKRNSEVPLAAGLVLRVTDSSDLIYYPEGVIYDYGVHEIRGPEFGGNRVIPAKFGDYPENLSAKWNSGNYTTFYMDPEKQLGPENEFSTDYKFGSESLVLHKANGRTVLPPGRPEVVNGTAILNGFQYSTIMRSKAYDFKPWGDYYVIPFLGDIWFAGYDKSDDSSRSTLNLLDHEKIGRVLIDSEVVQGNIFAGNYSLEEGYEIRIRDVEKDNIFVQLLKNGILQESSVVKSNSTYIYKKDLDDVKDMPIIKIHINSIFSNGSMRFATIDGIFQISDQILLPVEPGLGIGKLQIVSTSTPYAIIMVNDETINLNRDSTIALAPNMDLRVTDNDTLRYSLYSEKYVVPKPKPPEINLPANATSSVPANFSIFIQAAEISSVTADILDENNRTIWTKDITGEGQGFGEYWMYSWKWNATALHLNDDNSLVLDTSGGPVPALLRLNPSSPAVQVGVKFDPSGRIASILGNDLVYYVSPREYGQINSNLSFDGMLANNTTREQFLRIEPGKSILQFQDIINGRLVPNGINHTLQGTPDALEPHLDPVGAPSGRYEVRLRVENAVNAILASGEFFDVKPSVNRGVILGKSRIYANDIALIPLTAPATDEEKQISISYDTNVVKAESISGKCNPTWQVDPRAGRLSVLLPSGCGAANLTFISKGKANITTDINVIDTSGFEPERITNGSITILASDKAKKSNAPGLYAVLLALAFGAYVRRRA